LIQHESSPGSAAMNNAALRQPRCLRECIDDAGNRRLSGTPYAPARENAAVAPAPAPAEAIAGNEYVEQPATPAYFYIHSAYGNWH